MIEVKVVNKSANEILDIVRELKTQGMVQGQDFDFAFYQSRWDDMIGEIPKEAIFKFHTEKYATLFALKYI